MMSCSSLKSGLSRAQQFSSDNFCIGSLITGPVKYVIPAYQRPYAWTAVQVRQLMRDILDFLRADDPAGAYSLGTIVCDQETPGVFSILDGQQRLTTVDLLLGELALRLDRGQDGRRRRIISAYRYLAGQERCETGPLPACMAQRDCISAALNDFFDQQNIRDEGQRRDILVTLETCVLERVYVRRVVIPLSAKVKNEAPAMFEIINMRGQRLSALDLLKSRLLSRFAEEDRSGRELFTHLWRTAEERLASPFKAAEGFDLISSAVQQSVSYGHQPKSEAVLVPDEFTISEIISMEPMSRDTDGQTALASVPSDDESLLSDKQNEESEHFEPPIDVMNMLVIANELLSHEKAKRGTLEDREAQSRPLSTTNFDERFDGIVQAQAPGTADVWRLMGAFSIVLQAVGAWGRYRKAGGFEYEGEPDHFNQLIQTFMAANGFSYSAQYWLLLLSATALEESLGSDGKLPDDEGAFRSMKKPSFRKLRKIAELRLLAWAFRVAAAGQNEATSAVFKLMEETPTEEAAAAALKDAQASVRTDAREWRYDNGSISQFDLFLTDYVLWVDGHTAGDQRFLRLRVAMDDFDHDAETSEERKIARAFKVFDWSAFESKAQTLRIVARSDIEHWLARNRADLRKDANEELLRRHGYGNLALINESDNSSLGSGAPASKAEIVLKRMPNPTPKLLWLAVLSKKFPEMSGRHVKGLSEFWASYIGRFPFV